MITLRKSLCSSVSLFQSTSSSIRIIYQEHAIYSGQRSYCALCSNLAPPSLATYPNVFPSKRLYTFRWNSESPPQLLRVRHQRAKIASRSITDRIQGKLSAAGGAAAAATKKEKGPVGEKSQQRNKRKVLQVQVLDRVANPAGKDSPVLQHTQDSSPIIEKSNCDPALGDTKQKDSRDVNILIKTGDGDNAHSRLGNVKHVHNKSDTTSNIITDGVNISKPVASSHKNITKVGNVSSDGSLTPSPQTYNTAAWADSTAECSVNRPTKGEQEANKLNSANSRVDLTSSQGQVFVDNQTVSTEELLSHTTAFVRKVDKTQETHHVGGDIEYIVDDTPSHVTTRRAAAALDWRPITYNTASLPQHYAALAKSRLTALVVASALGGYVMAPDPMAVTSLLGVVLGTALISAAANTANQIIEAPYDSQMKRTGNRVLVKGLLTPLHASCFAGVCGVAGVGVLLGACNPLTAGLGAVNLLLYTAVYTPMKRITIYNTWVGAVVGAIPPLMGWCGCYGPLIGYDAWGAWLMAGLLFAWQFPHFNALSWNLRPDYSQAGYRMMCVTDPGLCRVTCIRYSLAMLAIGFAAPALDVTSWTFAVDSTPLNACMLYLSYRFYRDGDSKSSRNLFRFSLIHLPAVIVLMIISKKHKKKGTPEAIAATAAAGVLGTTAAGAVESTVIQ